MRPMVGTSGWQYRHWRDRFYPRGVAQRRWLEFYAEHFATVEVNNAFYRLPDKEVFEGWKVRTPPGFVVAVKASRYLTHIRRLRDPAEPVARLMDRITGLGDRLGPILLQLPPTLRADPDLLGGALACFPRHVRVAVEARHDSWWTPAVRDILERHQAALCWSDRAGRPLAPLWRTADWAYLRLHEGRADPWPRYARRDLAGWADRLSTYWPTEATAYVYFNNDQNGAAVVDARTFVEITAPSS